MTERVYWQCEECQKAVPADSHPLWAEIAGRHYCPDHRFAELQPKTEYTVERVPRSRMWFPPD